MRNILKRIALALTGLGLLTGVVPADAPRMLHDEVRNRIINEVSVDQYSPDLVRTALEGDPDFNLLLEYYQQRSLNEIPRSHLAGDAVQETFLKVWKGQPQVFLKPHDEVVKYMRTAAKRNLFTEFNKGKNQSHDLWEYAEMQHPGPDEDAAFADLYNAVASRLNPTELSVLELYLSSPCSERKIAAELGISRYAVNQAVDKIKELLHDLTR